jgi:hypothetical protein
VHLHSTGPNGVILENTDIQVFMEIKSREIKIHEACSTHEEGHIIPVARDLPKQEKRGRGKFAYKLRSSGSWPELTDERKAFDQQHNNRAGEGERKQVTPQESLLGNSSVEMLFPQQRENTH